MQIGLAAVTRRPGSTPSDSPLPRAAAQLAAEHPRIWQAYQTLGAEVGAAGPLDPRTQRLVHLALAIASGSEGAAHSHARRGVAEGLSSDELEHVALLAVTTLGWPQAVRGLTWIHDVTRSPAA